MLSAYVLIQTEVGKVAHVAQALGDVDGVQLAEDITGPYDVIARIQAPSLDQLGRLVVPHSGRGRRHPHPDLHGAPSVAARSAHRGPMHDLPCSCGRART
jgi:DNA-binding Lrp family transcriptional regulator